MIGVDYHGLNHILLENRFNDVKITTEWRAFATFAVDALGMPVEAMPFYFSSKRWKGKVDNRVLDFMMETGSSGIIETSATNRNIPMLVLKAISLWYHTADNFRYMSIIPKDSIKEWKGMIPTGVKGIIKETM